jgi:cytochrome c
MRSLIFLSLLACALCAESTKPLAGYRPLFNGKNLDGWETRGQGQWTVLSDGTLVAQRVWDRMMLSPEKKTFASDKEFKQWLDNQAWLYTKQEFGDFDLHVEFWTKTTGNSGISIRDSSRGEFGIATPPDFRKTPSKLGYEIQINNRYPDPTSTGSVYTFNTAPKDAMKEDDWNTFDIEVRKETIRVKLNGKLVSDIKCDPKRPVRGPIGLQLHDQFSLTMFRNVWIRDR